MPADPSPEVALSAAEAEALQHGGIADLARAALARAEQEAGAGPGRAAAAHAAAQAAEQLALLAGVASLVARARALRG